MEIADDMDEVVSQRAPEARAGDPCSGQPMSADLRGWPLHRSIALSLWPPPSPCPTGGGIPRGLVRVIGRVECVNLGIWLNAGWIRANLMCPLAPCWSGCGIWLAAPPLSSQGARHPTALGPAPLKPFAVRRHRFNRSTQVRGRHG